MEAVFHCVLGNKGGGGKSVVSAFLTEYLSTLGQKVGVLECDQGSRNISNYGALDVTSFDILDENRLVRPVAFDCLADRMLQRRDDALVMDNGQPSFLPLLEYFHTTKLIEVVAGEGWKTLLHFVAIGGKMKESSLHGLRDVVTAVGERAPIVVWRNHFFGPVEYDEVVEVGEASGVDLRSQVLLGKWPSMFESDLLEMLGQYETFADAIEGKCRSVMAASRLHDIREATFDAIGQALGVEEASEGIVNVG